MRLGIRPARAPQSHPIEATNVRHKVIRMHEIVVFTMPGAILLVRYIQKCLKSIVKIRPDAIGCKNYCRNLYFALFVGPGPDESENTSRVAGASRKSAPYSGLSKNSHLIAPLAHCRPAMVGRTPATSCSSGMQCKYASPLNGTTAGVKFEQQVGAV